MGLMKSEETIDWKELYFQLLDKLYPKKLEISLYSRLQTKELRLSSAVIHPIGFAVK